MCPSDKRFVEAFTYMPDDKEVIGSIDRSYEVHVKDIKIVLQGLTFSPSVLQKLMYLFKDRYIRTILFEMSSSYS